MILNSDSDTYIHVLSRHHTHVKHVLVTLHQNEVFVLLRSSQTIGSLLDIKEWTWFIESKPTNPWTFLQPIVIHI